MEKCFCHSCSQTATTRWWRYTWGNWCSNLIRKIRSGGRPRWFSSTTPRTTPARALSIWWKASKYLSSSQGLIATTLSRSSYSSPLSSLETLIQDMYLKEKGKKLLPILNFTNCIVPLFSHFQNVIEMVIERMKEIPKHHRVLFWHHSLQHAYKYLSFQKLWACPITFVSNNRWKKRSNNLDFC